MQKSDNIGDLATALSKAQGDIKGAVKDASNPFFKSKYADLASVWDAFREPFVKNGLSLVQLPSVKDNMVIVESVLMHASGQWVSSELGAVPKDMSPQAVGSAITYLRRYGAQSITGVCPEDDDGNIASGRPYEASRRPVQATQKPPEARSDDGADPDDILLKLTSCTSVDEVNLLLDLNRSQPDGEAKRKFSQSAAKKIKEIVEAKAK